jgi:hypothetical protein
MEEREKEIVLKKEESADKLPKKGWVFEIRGYTFHKDKEKFVINTLVANLREPEKMPVSEPRSEPSPSQPKFYQLSKELKERVKDKISFVCLYKHAKGGTGLIAKTYLRELLAAPKTQGVGGFAPMPMGGSPEGGADAAKGPTRDGWVAQGEVANKIFGSGAGVGGDQPGFTPPPSPVPGSTEPGALATQLPRTDFVVLFVWQEPTTLEADAPATTEGG